jgi:hypothetical protein
LIFAQLPVFDEIGNHGVQPIDGDEFLGEVKRRTEVVDSPVDVVLQIPCVFAEEPFQPTDLFSITQPEYP